MRYKHSGEQFSEDQLAKLAEQQRYFKRYFKLHTVRDSAIKTNFDISQKRFGVLIKKFRRVNVIKLS